jgi:hypothetical protein
MSRATAAIVDQRETLLFRVQEIQDGAAVALDDTAVTDPSPATRRPIRVRSWEPGTCGLTGQWKKVRSVPGDAILSP